MSNRIHHLFGGPGGSLRLTNEEYLEYCEDLKKLHEKYYLKERAAEGIWASNQSKYVQSIAEFNDWDDPTNEQLYGDLKHDS